MESSAQTGLEADKRPLSRKEVNEDTQEITDYVDLNQLPKFSVLSEQVDKVVKSSSWFDLYGVDLIILMVGLVGWFTSHILLSSQNTFVFLMGVVILGLCHNILTVKTSHCAIHNSSSPSKTVNVLSSYILIDFLGCFSRDVGYNMHIKYHHPYTNIIGLGDSSSWRAPFFPSYLYMFVAPLLLPILTPLVSVKSALALPPRKAIQHFLFLGSGIFFQFSMLSVVSRLNFVHSLFVYVFSRNILTIPYIHVNIFQHIGLPMFSQKQKPKRIYQMVSGVLNLPRNPVLDYCFGHGLVNCHVEHHLFPHLSDNMCLKVKPVVSKFCEENGLPYHYDTYMSRTKFFIEHYQRLMVDIPPITSFVGLQ